MQQTKNRPLWWALVALGAALILTLGIACGDDDDDTGDDDDASPTATMVDGDDDDSTEPTDEPSGDDDDTGDDDDDSIFGDIDAVIDDYEQADGVVTYTFTTDGESATWTLYSDGDSSRVDIISDEGGFITITTPDASYFCSESDGMGFCFSGEGGGATNPFAGLFTSFASAQAIATYANLFTGVDVDGSSEEIAGVDADCFTATGDFDGDAGTIKWCFAPNGLLLLAQYDLDSGTFEMRATEFSDSVPGGSFDPPYEVTDFGQGQ